MEEREGCTGSCRRRPSLRVFMKLDTGGKERIDVLRRVREVVEGSYAVLDDARGAVLTGRGGGKGEGPTASRERLPGYVRVERALAGARRRSHGRTEGPRPTARGGARALVASRHSASGVSPSRGPGDAPGGGGAFWVLGLSQVWCRPGESNPHHKMTKSRAFPVRRGPRRAPRGARGVEAVLLPERTDPRWRNRGDDGTGDTKGGRQGPHLLVPGDSLTALLGTPPGGQDGAGARSLTASRTGTPQPRSRRTWGRRPRSVACLSAVMTCSAEDSGTSTSE